MAKREIETVFGRLNTGGISIEQFHKECSFYSDEDVAYLKRAYDLFDGLTVILSKQECGGYHLWDWTDDIDGQIMLAMYQLEQMSVFGAYYDDWDRFASVWQSGKYDSGGPIAFAKSEVEVLE